MHKRVIIMAPNLRERHTDNYKILFKMFAKRHDFEIVYADVPYLPEHVDTAIIHGIPHHSFPTFPLEPYTSNKRTKIILYPRDLQSFAKPTLYKRMTAMMARANYIIHFAEEYFQGVHWEFAHKAEFFSQFTISSRSSQQDIGIRRNKVILVGALDQQIYPMRHMLSIRSLPNVEIISTSQGLLMGLTGSAYYNFLKRYTAGFSDASIFRMALAKYFEIPSCGCLLIAEECNDARSAGFLPGINYIGVNKETILTEIDNVTTRPSAYDEIRERGYQHVLTFHTEKNRLERLTEIYNTVINRRE